MFFFFKQKTAYEMRISDWSSDVCSSDLAFTCTGRTQKGVRRSQPGTSLTPMRGALAGRADDQDPRLGRRQRLAGRPEAHPRQAHDGKSAADLLDRPGEEADPAGRPGLDRTSPRLNSSH